MSLVNNQIKLENYQSYFNSRVIRGNLKLREFCIQIPRGKTLIISSKNALKRKKVKKIIDNLGNQECEFFTDVEPNPDLQKLESSIKVLKKNYFNTILAIGGGSVIDSAKAILLFLNSPFDNPISTYFRDGSSFNLKKELFFAVVPTTSGTGSEVTPFSTIWDFKNVKKYSLESKLLYPDLIYLDPEITSTLPFDQTLFPGLDATSHALETIWNRNSDKDSISIAYDSLRLIVNSFPYLLKDLKNLEFRSMMQDASFLAGISISRSKTAIAHSISYPLTSKFNVPHGIACSFTLVSIINFLEERQFEFLDRTLIEEVKEMLINIKISKHLSSFIKKEQILSLVNKMYSPERAKNFHEEISIDEIKSIVRNSIISN